jgi:hypothetical protein
MRTAIFIAPRQTPAGIVYTADVIGAFGGGYRGAHAGDTAEEAALFAIREMRRYALTNPRGGDLVAPPDVLAHIPRELRTVAARGER